MSASSAPDQQQQEQEPKTPMGGNSPTCDNVLSETQEKMLSDLTPSSRGIGSNLRVMTRDAMIGMRKFKVHGRGNRNCYGDEDGDDNNEDVNRGGYYGSAGCGDDFMDSCGGDDAFSSHASPGCARIGRMLSAPSQQPRNPVARTSTTPF
jgi:hypothetical protein